MSDRSGALPLLPTGLASGMEKLRGHLAMILFAALISLSFSLGSLAAPHIGPAALNAMRFFIATMVMGLVVFALYRRIPLPRAQAWRFGVLGSLMAIYFVTMFMALGMTTPISTGAVFTLIPLMSAGFGFPVSAPDRASHRSHQPVDCRMWFNLGDLSGRSRGHVVV